MPIVAFAGGKRHHPGDLDHQERPRDHATPHRARLRQPRRRRGDLRRRARTAEAAPPGSCPSITTSTPKRGYLDAAACTALVGDRDHADFYVCGPGAYMEVVEEALTFVDVAPDQVFIERFVVPEVAPPSTRQPRRIPDDHAANGAHRPFRTNRVTRSSRRLGAADCARRSRARWATAPRAWPTSTTDRRRCAPTTR